jgi:hypothetical protein
VAEYRRTSDGTAETDSMTNGEARDTKPDRDKEQLAIKEVRASDIEPYTGLRYLSKLFRFMGVILVLLLVAEVATGIYTQGAASVPTLLGEASRLIVLAGVLWGTGDLAHLLIDVGHDVRAARILVARVAHARGASLPSATTRVAGADVTVDRQIVPRRNFADRIDNGDDDGPPIP